MVASTEDGPAEGDPTAPAQRIWQVVASIPAGKVATYGQVAALAGLPTGARVVGRVLAALPQDSRLPWQRVVNAKGEVSLRGDAAARQRRLLRDEGVAVRSGRIDLDAHGWEPGRADVPRRRNRIDRVTTGSGDRGETSLADGRRYRKHDARIHLVGALDEANSALGLLATELDAAAGERLGALQSRLFDIGAAVAGGNRTVDWLRQAADLRAATTALNERLPPLREFILPGGGRAAALAHLARTVVRRAERHWWEATAEDERLRESDAGVYLNRLSDYLFVLARANAEEERLWRPLG